MDTTLDRLDEYGPNLKAECHYGTCREAATAEVYGVPFCRRHAAARTALGDRLVNR